MRSKRSRVRFSAWLVLLRLNKPTTMSIATLADPNKAMMRMI